MSEEERESLQSDLESARLNIKETERMLEVATARNADLEEEIRAMRGETEGYTAKVYSFLIYRHPGGGGESGKPRKRRARLTNP